MSVMALKHLSQLLLIVHKYIQILLLYYR